MPNVRRFENGLKLSIRGKIVGLRLQDMDSMVGTALVIKREMDDAQGIRDASAGGKRKENLPTRLWPSAYKTWTLWSGQP